MEEKIKNLRLIAGELADIIWSVPQAQWFDWANTNLVFVQDEDDGDMIKNIFTSNEGQGWEPFRMIVWVDPLNWGYQEAIIRGLHSQLEVDLFLSTRFFTRKDRDIVVSDSFSNLLGELCTTMLYKIVRIYHWEQLYFTI